jgi:hypothetical protein
MAYFGIYYYIHYVLLLLPYILQNQKPQWLILFLVQKNTKIQYRIIMFKIRLVNSNRIKKQRLYETFTQRFAEKPTVAFSILFTQFRNILGPGSGHAIKETNKC